MNKTNRSKKLKKRTFTGIVSLIFFLEGMMFFNHYSYAHQLDVAQNNLEQLEDILSGKSRSKPLGASLLGIYDEPEDGFSEIRLRNLTDKIVSSTESAIRNADDITQTKKLKQAVEEISQVQEKQVIIIHQTLDKVESEEIGQQIESTYQKAIVLKEKVDQAAIIIQTAIDNDEDTIEIDIIDDSDPHEKKHEAEPETAQAMPIQHKNPNIERIEQQKIDDAAQREANRKRIMLIEEGREAKKAQEMKNKIQTPNQKNMHD